MWEVVFFSSCVCYLADCTSDSARSTTCVRGWDGSFFCIVLLYCENSFHWVVEVVYTTIEDWKCCRLSKRQVRILNNLICFRSKDIKATCSCYPSVKNVLPVLVRFPQSDIHAYADLLNAVKWKQGTWQWYKGFLKPLWVLVQGC